VSDVTARLDRGYVRLEGAGPLAGMPPSLDEGVGPAQQDGGIGSTVLLIGLDSADRHADGV
jgi:hypothetical protein